VNHAIPDVGSRHYDQHDYLDEKRDALKRWGDKIARIVA